jgi:hypothetical protein
MNEQFERANRAVTRAAAAIERTIATLLSKTSPLEAVAPTYVIEQLIAELMERNPKALDFLNTVGFGPCPLPGKPDIEPTSPNDRV